MGKSNPKREDNMKCTFTIQYRERDGMKQLKIKVEKPSRKEAENKAKAIREELEDEGWLIVSMNLTKMEV